MKTLLAALLTLSFTGAACAQGPRVPADDPFAGEINNFAELDVEDPQPPCAYLFVGSSMIKNWTTLERDMRPKTVINRGFGGSMVRHINLYFDRIVTPYKPRAIVVYSGDNDVAASIPPAEVVADYEKLVALKREKLGYTPLYLMSVKPSPERWAKLEAQREVNAALVKIAEAQDVVFIDTASSMLENGKPKDIYSDGLHFTAAGYAIWTRIVNDALAQPAPTRAPGC